MNRHRMACAWTIAIGLSVCHVAHARSADCARLAKLRVAHTNITSAEVVKAGAFTPPPRGGAATAASAGKPYSHMPAFCRVAGIRHPTADSNIRFEIWMPAAGWNGKLVGVGNGAWAGSIPYAPMVEPLTRGYATAATDSGHQGRPLDASFAAGHPERLADFGYRAIHEMTVAAKEAVKAFYGRPTERSLFVSCSTGGRQGLMEAYRYPGDYDGISSMAAANPTVPLMIQSLWASAATSEDRSSRISPALFDQVHIAVVSDCDADDGVKDGIVSAPERCHFDPASLRCKSGDDRTGGGGVHCLTPKQVGALRAIYQGPRNPRTGQSIFPGFERGSERMLSIQASGSGPIPPVRSYFRDLVFTDPQWNFRSFDYDEDIRRALSLHSQAVDVPPTGMVAYLTSGGKLLMSHGWADPLVPPRASVSFYTALTADLGASGAAKYAFS